MKKDVIDKYLFQLPKILDLRNFKFKESKIALDVNKTKQLKLIDQSYNNVSYSSSNNDIVTVSSNGLVTRLSKGTVTITARYKNKTDTCQVFDLNKSGNFVKDDTGASYLHSIGIKGKGVKVACFDEITKSNSEVTVYKWYDTVNDKEYTTQPTGINNTTEHSPKMASILCGKTTGIAPEATFYSLIADYTSNMADMLIKALDYCIKEHIDILNISMGGGYCDSRSDLKEAYKRAYEAGVIICKSASNIASNKPLNFCLLNEISNAFSFVISSLKKDKTLLPSSVYGCGLIDFTNYGEKIPCYNGSSYITVSGTSPATAISSGICALIKQQNPDLTPKEVYYILKGSTELVCNIQRNVKDEKYGYGLIQAPVLNNIDHIMTSSEIVEYESHLPLNINYYTTEPPIKNFSYFIIKVYIELSELDKYIPKIICIDDNIKKISDDYSNRFFASSPGTYNFLLIYKELGLSKKITITVNKTDE